MNLTECNLFILQDVFQSTRLIVIDESELNQSKKFVRVKRYGKGKENI
jgi:hypothetical protein